MRLCRQTVEAGRQALWMLRRNRLVWLLALATLAITGLSVAIPERVARGMSGDDLFGLPAYLLVMQFGLPTVVSYLGLFVVHDEISDRSVVHVFAQPVPRPALLVGKWLAVAGFAALAAAAVCVAYWVALSLPERPWKHGVAPQASTLWTFVLGAAVAAPGYAAVGVLCGAWSRRPLITAIAFVVGWELMVSNLPPQAGIRGWTVADPLRRLLLERIDPPAGSELGEVLQASLAGQGTSGLADPIPSLAWFTAVALGLAILIYTRREYDARARD